MKNQSVFTIFFLSLALLFYLCGCQSTKTAENYGNLNSNEVEVEYGSLFFDSVDQLCQAIKEYSSSYDDYDENDQRLFKENDFEELNVDYYPQMLDNSFSLLTIEVNKYNVFYYYIPIGISSFSYSNGIVVSVPRENEATMENIKKQFPSAIETGDSLFVNEINSWFIPIENSFYKISYPASMINCEKDIIEMIPIDCANNTQ